MAKIEIEVPDAYIQVIADAIESKAVGTMAQIADIKSALVSHMRALYITGAKRSRESQLATQSEAIR